MQYQLNPERVILGNAERKRPSVHIDRSAAYWYGVALDWDDIVDYDGRIGVKVDHCLSPSIGPETAEEMRQRWYAAKQPGAIRELKAL